jgi:hypothetical protein
MVTWPWTNDYSGWSISFDFNAGDPATRLDRLTTSLNKGGYDTLHSRTAPDQNALNNAAQQYKSAFGVENPVIESVFQRSRVVVIISRGWEVAVLSHDWRRVLSFIVAIQIEVQQILLSDMPLTIDQEPNLRENLPRRIGRGVAPLVSGLGAGLAFAYIAPLGTIASVLLAGASYVTAQLILSRTNALGGQ